MARTVGWVLIVSACAGIGNALLGKSDLSPPIVGLTAAIFIGVGVILVRPKTVKPAAAGGGVEDVEQNKNIPQWLMAVSLVVVLLLLWLAGSIVLSLLRGDLSPEEERRQAIACEYQGGYWNSFYEKCYIDEGPALP